MSDTGKEGKEHNGEGDNDVTVSQPEDGGVRSRFAAKNTLQVNTDVNPSSQNSSFIEEEIVAGDDNGDDDDDEAKYEYSDDFEESDEEENGEPVPNLPIIRQRDPNPDLPNTVTVLETECGSKVYVVGTSHFSKESQEDVAKTIQAVQPDVVMVELCNGRISILQLDEEKLLEEAKNISMDKMILSIRQSGVIQGILHLLFLSVSAHFTKELGMAPGGEFRRAFHEAKKIEGCRLQLGDRPVNITLQRALASLSVWQKVRLAWHLITGKEPITKEDVEKFKQKDLLEELLSELTGEFPALSKVFVHERDFFLAHSLRHASEPLAHPGMPNGILPVVVVGVVGIGHVQGIQRNWAKEEFTMQEVMKVPKRSLLGTIIKMGVRFTVLGLLSYGGFKLYKLVKPIVS